MLTIAPRGGSLRLTMRTLRLVVAFTRGGSERNRTRYFWGTDPVHQKSRDLANE